MIKKIFFIIIFTCPAIFTMDATQAAIALTKRRRTNTHNPFAILEELQRNKSEVKMSGYYRTTSELTSQPVDKDRDMGEDTHKELAVNALYYKSSLYLVIQYVSPGSGCDPGSPVIAFRKIGRTQQSTVYCPLKKGAKKIECPAAILDEATKTFTLKQNDK